MGGGGQAGGEVDKRSDGEGKHGEPELIRCCDDYVLLSLIFSLLSSLTVSPSSSGAPRSAAKKHYSFTFNLLR